MIVPRDDDGTKDPSTIVDLVRVFVRHHVPTAFNICARTHRISSLQQA
jgi:hypothetical protein